jgi:ElaA protein
MDYNFSYKHFSELSTTELYKILKLRQDVFIVEQNCIYADLDDVDLNCFHLMMIKNSELIGYSRIIAPGIKYTSSSIGRVIIKPEFRGNKLAYSLMKESINCCNIDWKNFGISISAQFHLMNFYFSLGFIQHGEVYDEDGIPHIKMVLEISEKLYL